MLESNVVPFVKKKPITEMTNEELTIEAERLENLADLYSRTDRNAMFRVELELRAVDRIILDRYNTENEQWLINLSNR